MIDFLRIRRSNGIGRVSVNGYLIIGRVNLARLEFYTATDVVFDWYPRMWVIATDRWLYRAVSSNKMVRLITTSWTRRDATCIGISTYWYIVVCCCCRLFSQLELDTTNILLYGSEPGKKERTERTREEKQKPDSIFRIPVRKFTLRAERARG